MIGMIRKADRLSSPPSAMRRKFPLYVHHQTTRHGRSLLYFRKEHHGRRVRLRATFGTPEFWAEYNSALAGSVPESRRCTPARSVDCGTATETTAWSNLSHATRRQRENIMRNVLVKSGAKTFTSSRAPTLWRSVTRSERRHRCAACSSGRSKHSMSRSDPAAGVKAPARKKGGGFATWTEEEVRQYEQRWPEGTNQRIRLEDREGGATLLCSGRKPETAGRARHGQAGRERRVNRLPRTLE
jgi:hypothetical protein